MNNKKYILVTGGLGYIGSHTIIELLKNNQNVLCVDNLSNSNINIFEKIKKVSRKSFKFLKLDLSKKTSIQKIINLKIDLVSIIHFAAMKYVNDSIQEPLQYYSNNLNSTINLLELCKSYKKINFVFSSSCTVYGKVKNPPVSEITQLMPSSNPYGETKKICEKIIDDFSKENKNFKFCCLRYFNPAGAHNSYLIGEDPKAKYKNLVPSICEAYKMNKPININGNDYLTKDGTCIRDFIHVMDIATAHVKAINYLKQKNKNKIKKSLNLGLGRGYTVLQVIKMFEKVNSVKIKKEFMPRRKGDIEKIWSDNRLSKKELSWFPKYTLKDIVKSAYKWTINQNIKIK